VLLELAEAVGLNMAQFTQAFDNGAARAAVLEECRLGREQYKVRGTPTLMLADGSKLRSPIAYPVMQEHRIVRVQKLPCCGEGCLTATRELFERALRQPQA
jgi:protein-disulfide isomerase-like protein with CxxC motif